MKDVELLVGDAGEEADRVLFGGEGQDEGQTSDGHPAAARGDRRRVPVVDFSGIRPVVGALAEGHGHEEDKAECSC